MSVQFRFVLIFIEKNVHINFNADKIGHFMIF